jgi:hypothetical protein
MIRLPPPTGHCGHQPGTSPRPCRTSRHRRFPLSLDPHRRCHGPKKPSYLQTRCPMFAPPRPVVGAGNTLDVPVMVKLAAKGRYWLLWPQGRGGPQGPCAAIRRSKSRLPATYQRQKQARESHHRWGAPTAIATVEEEQHSLFVSSTARNVLSDIS